MWKININLPRFEILQLLIHWNEGKCTFCDGKAVAKCKTCKRPVCIRHLLASGDCGVPERRWDHSEEN